VEVALNVSGIFDGLAGLPGARDSGAADDGISVSRLLNGIEYAHTSVVEEASFRMSISGTVPHRRCTSAMRE